MIPEISEFSYGFALTNELIGWEELRAAPIFPSLIEEGKEGGGYDVNLDFPGAPLFLQFKRSEYMSRRSAKEYKKIVDEGGVIAVPFYRFPITGKLKSDQHEMLLELEAEPAHRVYYVAPRFHTLREINTAWSSFRVASRSVFVKPSDIGSLDFEQHTVAFDQWGTWLCSNPRKIQAHTSRDVLNTIKAFLNESKAPLRHTLPTLVEELRAAENRGRERIHEKRELADSEIRLSGALVSEIKPIDKIEPISQIEAPEPSPVRTRNPSRLGGDRQVLREAADIASHVFNTQLVIVQAKAAGPESSERK